MSTMLKPGSFIHIRDVQDYGFATLLLLSLWYKSSLWTCGCSSIFPDVMNESCNKERGGAAGGQWTTLATIIYVYLHSNSEIPLN